MISGMIKKIYIFLINNIYVGTKFWREKRFLMRRLGHEVGEGTKIVGPVFCTGKLVVGKNCWIGKNITVNGNATVVIGDNCDVAPEVTFQTGGHEIGERNRRAGKGWNKNIIVGDGCWIGGRCTILGGVHIDEGSLIAACACVCNDVAKNEMVGGIPAKLIRKLE